MLNNYSDALSKRHCDLLKHDRNPKNDIKQIKCDYRYVGNRKS